MREMVRPTSAADINSRSGLGAATGDLDLLLRLSGRIVKGCQTAGTLPPEGRSGATRDSVPEGRSGATRDSVPEGRSGATRDSVSEGRSGHTDEHRVALSTLAG